MSRDTFWRRKWQPTPLFFPVWRATLYGVTKSQTRLSIHTHTHTHTQTCLVVTTGGAGSGSYLQLVGEGQGDGSTSHKAQDGPTTQSYPAPNLYSAKAEKLL